jgi:predicted DNA-binding protein (MmcQ/YjbR family)
MQGALDALAKLAEQKPGAWVDHPWGHVVYKVGKKIFVFLGLEDGTLSITCKLPHSGEAALTLFSFTEPTGYGLGKSGWVSASFAKGVEVPMPLLREWIDESYAALAPKRVAAGKAVRKAAKAPAKKAAAKAAKER